MTIRFGVSPIAWINDDMPELGAGVSVETILQDAQEIGFSGVELGGAFPREAEALKPMLAAHSLDLIGGWFSGSLLRHDVDDEIAASADHLALLKAMGSKVFIYAETSNAIHGQLQTSLTASPKLDEGGWRRFGTRITEFADFIAGQGLRFAYHHHLGTVVETPADLRSFLKCTGASAGLTVDTGHAALAGVDPVELILGHPDRLAHVHCKNVRSQVFAGVRTRRESFLEGVLAGMFTVPGDRGLDFGPLMSALARIGYAGWVVVEAEQDPALADPRTYAQLGLRTLRLEAGVAGLEAA